MTSKEILQKYLKCLPFAVGIFLQIAACAGAMNYGFAANGGSFYGVVGILALLAGVAFYTLNIIKIIKDI